MEGSFSLYNRIPLDRCSATFIGKHPPTNSLRYPEIVHEPVSKIYRSDSVKKGLKANIHVYDSGIIVEEGRKINWFPIENLYCSAGLLPEKTSKGYIFKHLNERKDGEHIFAMVVRQIEDGVRRVLMCHVFIVNSSSVAQGLVNATQHAYQNKDGWNHTLNDRQFSNAKINFMLHRIDDRLEEKIGELKKETASRDQKLSKLPGANVLDTASDRQMVRQAKPVTSQSMYGSLQVVPARPHPTDMIAYQSRISPTPQNTMVLYPHSMAISTPRAVSVYQGFQTDLINNANDLRIQKSASVIGYPVSQSSSQSAAHFQPVITSPLHARIVNKGKRQNSAPPTPRSHRILASFEPMDSGTSHPVNGTAGGNGHFEAFDWDELMPYAVNGQLPARQSKSRKKFTEYMLEAYSQPEASSHKQKDTTSSGELSKSDSGYSIEMNSPPAAKQMNGFISIHADADQNL